MYVNPIKNVNECGIILFDNTMNNILIIYQNESKKWGLPKGKMEEHEIENKKYFDCAKRELQEETGIMITAHRYKKIKTIIIKNKLFYIIQILKNFNTTQKPLDKTEIGNIQWININNVHNFVNETQCNITLKIFSQMMFNDYSKPIATY